MSVLGRPRGDEVKRSRGGWAAYGLCAGRFKL